MPNFVSPWHGNGDKNGDQAFWVSRNCLPLHITALKKFSALGAVKIYIAEQRINTRAALSDLSTTIGSNAAAPMLIIYLAVSLIMYQTNAKL